MRGWGATEKVSFLYLMLHVVLHLFNILIDILKMFREVGHQKLNNFAAPEELSRKVATGPALE